MWVTKLSQLSIQDCFERAPCTLPFLRLLERGTCMLAMCRRDHEHTWLPAQLDAIDKVLLVQVIACSHSFRLHLLLCLGRVQLRL
jgi:hypothetical protein